MTANPLIQLGTLGQSIWLDYIRRDLMTPGPSGHTPLHHLIEDDGLRGITSNPSIFEKAIDGGQLYDAQIRSMAAQGMTPQAIYESIAQKDVQMAADEFRPLYDATDGRDGYVSLEVNPHLAHDTEGSLEEARRLWSALNRPNVFIKVPATREGLPAIQQLISEGINVNVTLIFGLPRYREVTEAYLAGIESRIAQKQAVARVASVASFFVSRIDAMVDPLIEAHTSTGSEHENLAQQLHGQVAIASAQQAYQVFKELFHGERFMESAKAGARVQRPLWASTGVKNPQDRDVKYVEALIGPDTVNTVPVETLNAFRDHGSTTLRLDADTKLSAWVLERLPELGISLDGVARKLEEEGVDKFIKPFDALMEALTRRSRG